MSFMSISNESIIEPSANLPPYIIQILKRKSSRDPNSRFAKKLYILLEYVTHNPAQEQEIGLNWVSDTEFRMNKRIVSQVMGIKLNTLNVNLKGLGFQQVHGDQAGWTQWIRPGFTRGSSISDLAEVKSDRPAAKEAEKTPKQSAAEDTQLIRLSTIHGLSLGSISAEGVHAFKRIVLSIWEELLPSVPSKLFADPAEFLSVAAERFRISKQSLKNAHRVIEAIFVCAEPNQLTILDFAKFMAKFGPEETLMEKIGSLLSASNSNGNWLRLAKVADEGSFDTPPFYGYFDEEEHNCFVLRGKAIGTKKVWNLIDVASPGPYLKDSDGNTYCSWQNFFKAFPIENSQQGSQVDTDLMWFAS